MWNLIWKFRAMIALSSVIALPISAYPQAPAPVQPVAPPATPVPPPSSPAKLSVAELEKLLMPIALYPDALLATMLPASVYPLEIVQAARFLQDTNNASKIDQQSWDDTVKAVARIPAALKKMNDDLPWTIQLGEVFLNQDKDVMDMIQSLRMKAQKAGTLRTTEQQIVVVTNMIVETKIEQQVVVVTNTVVQIQPANSQVVYVPTYPPTVYYPPPAYVYNPWAPLITFSAGVAMGAIIANNCDWHHGGCYGGGNDININNNNNINVGNNNNVNRGDRNNAGNRPSQTSGGGKKWQPDANRVRSSGSGTSAKTMESRGWGSGTSAAGGARASTQPATGNRGGGASSSARPSTPSAGTRPSSPSAGTRPSAGSPSAGTSARSGSGARPSASPSTTGRSSGSSAFSGGGSNTRQTSQRGASSRISGGFGGGSRGGGSRGGGRR